MMDGRLQIFTGNAHPALAADITRELEAPLGRAIVGQWKNGETRVKLEENVRGSDVFVIQSICNPVDHQLMELLLMIDALRLASASRITAGIPY
jgi:ribose-phosphate pyrophosphokinase